MRAAANGGVHHDGEGGQDADKARHMEIESTSVLEEDRSLDKIVGLEASPS